MEAATEALRLKSDDPEAIAIRTEATKQKSHHQAETLQERFEALIRTASDSISRGDTDGGSRALSEAKTLFPNDPRISELQARMIPLLWEKSWETVAQQIKESPYSAAGTIKYKMDLATVREGTAKAISETLSFWRLKEEQKPDDQTIIMTLDPRGLGHQRAAILMLSAVGNSQVELRYRVCMYPGDPSKASQVNLGIIAFKVTNSTSPSDTRKDLDSSVSDLLASFKRHLDSGK